MKQPKVYYVTTPESQKGWWFSYVRPAKGEEPAERTGDGPFPSKAECEDILHTEMEDLFTEFEGEL